MAYLLAPLRALSGCEVLWVWYIDGKITAATIDQGKRFVDWSWWHGPFTLTLKQTVGSELFDIW